MTARSALLLRAVNVGGRNRVPMAELRALLAERTELRDISTYIASGNVIATVPGDLAETCRHVRALIQESFGVDTPVIARTHQELRHLLAHNPFPDASAPKMVHVMFLEGAPHTDAAQTLAIRLRPGERVHAEGVELWIDYGTAGVAETRLTRAVLDRALGVAGTARNLFTLRTLVDLTAAD